MKVYPNAKINIGLDIIKKRNDGFHELDTFMMPIPLCDELSFNVCDTGEDTTFTCDGITIDGNFSDNLVYKAYKLLDKHYPLPNLNIQLKKIIPFGAGLGGGSADASFMLSALNDFFNLNISSEELESYAAQLGSDCPIFINNQSAMARGRGEILESHSIDLSKKSLVLIIPDIAISTAAAYKLVKPNIPQLALASRLKEDISTWKEQVENGFELSVFEQFPAVKNVKTDLYELGASYASLSGSGSTVFGIFDKLPNYEDKFPKNYFKWSCSL